MESTLSSTKEENIISVEDVLQRLQNASSFFWCLYFKCNIIRHVGIMIWFDGMPFCTVDFGVEKLCLRCLVACKSKVRIKRVPPDFQHSVDLGVVMQRLPDISDESLRQEVEEIIHILVTPNQNLYSLLFNNCRDNTRDVMNRVCSSGQCKGKNWKDSRQMLLRTQNRDLRYQKLFLTFVVLVLAVILMLKLF